MLAVEDRLTTLWSANAAVVHDTLLHAPMTRGLLLRPVAQRLRNFSFMWMKQSTVELSRSYVTSDLPALHVSFTLCRCHCEL